MIEDMSNTDWVMGIGVGGISDDQEYVWISVDSGSDADECPMNFGGQADYFFLFVVTSIGVGVGVALATPLLKKLIQGRDQNDAPTPGH